jgi:hypothetical protein
LTTEGGTNVDLPSLEKFTVLETLYLEDPVCFCSVGGFFPSLFNSLLCPPKFKVEILPTLSPSLISLSIEAYEESSFDADFILDVCSRQLQTLLLPGLQSLHLIGEMVTRFTHLRKLDLRFATTTRM